MNVQDTGEFIFDQQYPPFHVRDPTQTTAKRRASRNMAMQIAERYVKQAAEERAHHLACMSSGMCVGEACTMYVREHVRTSSSVDHDLVTRHTSKTLLRLAQVDTDRYRECFGRHMRVFSDNLTRLETLQHKLKSAVDAYLKEINFPKKGRLQLSKSVAEEVSKLLLQKQESASQSEIEEQKT